MDADKGQSANNQPSLEDRVRDELEDNLDEELELELGDDLLARLPDSVADIPPTEGIDRRRYFTELLRLQRELIKLQDWVVDQKLKVVVLFEGRDAAGKGGVIKRVTQRLNPRICRTVALSAPSERERTQWYFQRYVCHLPAAGEIVLFDRSWYNRAGVERVMGFCGEAEVEEFFRTVPEFERMLVRSGIILVKYWFSITDPEQNLRFLMRVHDPLKQWKLSPMDLQSRRRWEEYTKAKEEMLARTHIPEARWWVVDGNRQASRAAELHPSPAAAGAVQRCRSAKRSCCPSASTSPTTHARRCPRRCTCRRFIDWTRDHSRCHPERSEGPFLRLRQVPRYARDDSSSWQASARRS